MQPQELMLNDNVNINFQYGDNLYKVKMNIRNGVIIVGKLAKDGNEENNEIISVVLLGHENKEEPCTEQEPVLELEQKEGNVDSNGKQQGDKPKRKNSRKKVKGSRK